MSSPGSLAAALRSPGAPPRSSSVAGGFWLATRHKTDPRFDRLMAQGDEAFRTGAALDGATVTEEHGPRMADLYRQAVRIQPDSARAWGLLAYFTAWMPRMRRRPNWPGSSIGHRSPFVAPCRSTPTSRMRGSRCSFCRGQCSTGQRATDSSARILATDPNNLPAMTELMPLLQAAGLTRESWMWNERILRASPFARGFLGVKAMKLWILGDVPASDKVIDRVRSPVADVRLRFPGSHDAFTLTGRPRRRAGDD